MRPMEILMNDFVKGLEWRCRACDKLRPDAAISTVSVDASRAFGLPPGTSSINVNHCNDDGGACQAGAEAIAQDQLEAFAKNHGQSRSPGRQNIEDFANTILKPNDVVMDCDEMHETEEQSKGDDSNGKPSKG